jgi:NAD(P)-dependent dehydrogenase (short-subunit alcohol dehydrogenase family)
MKTFVITGAGSGIGRATAQVLSATPNVKLILVGRRKETLEETKNLLSNPETHVCAPMDICDKNAWKALFDGLKEKDLNLCGVFANAGIGGENHYGDHDRWHEIITTNLTGTYVTVHECLPYLKQAKNKFKHIVITSSCLARFGVPNYTAYCTAKTGLLGLTRSLAVQYAREGILVNAICPGWIETEMAKAGIQMLADRSGMEYQQSFDEQMNMVPTGRIGQPEEIGQLINFLFSDLQTSMTGQGIDINNGSYMQ